MGFIIKNTGSRLGSLKIKNSGASVGKFNIKFAPSTSALLLDTYPGASAAYSLRKLRTAYNGSAIRVRRDSDNTEQDIGFVNNTLDTASLQSFVGSENYVYWSQNFTQTGVQGWTAEATTITANAGTAPDGTNTANNCVISAATITKGLYQSLPSVSTRDYVFSIYAKANQYNYAQLNAVRDSTNRYSIVVDLTTGLITQTNTVGTPNFVSSSVTSVGNGWYRIMITLNINLGFNYFAFSPSPVSNPTLNSNLSIQNPGDGTSGVLFWGAQLNYNSLKTYQVTTTNQAIYCSGYITTWYDQSGNTRNVIQTTSAYQPIIVSAASITLFGTKPSLYFSANALSNSSFTLTQPNTYFIVTQGTSTNSTGDRNIFDGTGANRNAIGKSNSNSNYFLYAGTGPIYSTTPVNNNKSLFVPVFNSGASFLYLNGTAILSNANPGAQSLQGLRIGGYTDTQALWESYMPEFIVYNSDQSSNRTAIESNINSYYSIY